MNEKLTAYALNELPPDERAEFEAQLKSDPALRREADEMQTFCAMLSHEVADDEATLTTSQRVSVMRAFKDGPVKEKPAPAFWRRPAFFIPTALAASVAVAAVVIVRDPGSVHGKRVAAETVSVTLEKDEHPSSVPAARRPAPALPSPVVASAAPTPPLPPVLPGGNDNMAVTSTGGFKSASTGSLAYNDQFGNSGSMSRTGDGSLTFDNSTLVPKEGAAVSGGRATPSPTIAANGGANIMITSTPLNPDIRRDPTVAGMTVTETGTVSGTVSGSGTSPGLPASSGNVVKSGAAVVPLQASNQYTGMTGNYGGALDSPANPTTPPSASLAMTPDGTVTSQRAAGTTGWALMESDLKSAPPGTAFATPSAAPATTTTPAKPLNTLAFGDDKSLRENETVPEGDLNARHREVESKKKQREASGETYTQIYENPFLFVAQQPLSTFSIDVDTASYANVRRFLNDGQRPPADAVRLEELINYFPYTYEGPSDGKPFGVMVDVAESPWQPQHRLVRVAIKGRDVAQERGTANFVFLVDVSGSMDSPDKLPLVQRSLEMLTRQLGEKDRVALVVYAGSSGLVLPSTLGSERETILNAIGNLKAGGSTNGASGITLAYQEAAKHFVKGGVNRVILCTDGDFNVGLSTPEALEKLIAEKAKSRIFLSVLGFGTGNLKDRTMETLADKGNGNYAYLDSLSEARKVLVEQMNGTLVTIAKDVKIQVEFNPAQVAAYRLLGYENRLLAKEDFNNDKKDAGEIGAGHTVTALYEVVPANVKFPDGKPLVDDLKYAAAPKPITRPADEAAAAPQSPPASPSNEMLTVKLRYKQPEGDKSDLLEVPVTDKEQKLADSPRDFQFAASVAGFGMLLRGSQHAGELTWDMVRELALRGKGEDAQGYRGEFLQLIDKARGLTEPGPQ